MQARPSSKVLSIRPVSPLAASPRASLGSAATPVRLARGSQKSYDHVLNALAPLISEQPELLHGFAQHPGHVPELRRRVLQLLQCVVLSYFLYVLF